MAYALHKLAKSEEKYLALNGRYTTDVSKLEPFTWDPGVTIAVVAATEQGWAAKASFSLFPGKSCVMWRGELDASYAGRATHPVFIALGPTARQYAIPRDPFSDLIDAFVQDQTVSRYRNWEELF